MTRYPWIDLSCKVYQTLLYLYPKDHQISYGSLMMQLFKDQCRSAYQQKGMGGLFLFWLRLIPDLVHSIFLEQFSSPRSSLGLMEPVPNAPLPWKGIFLMLLPGMVYLVSQIVQLNGEAWYFPVYYRAAFILILPVIIVWVVTRRFPVWGLIPVGLLYRLVQEIGYQLITLHPDAFSSNPVLNTFLSLAKLLENDFMISFIFILLAIIFLAWQFVKNQKPTRGFWIMLGIYILIFLINAGEDVMFLLYAIQNKIFILIDNGLLQKIMMSVFDQAYNFSTLLLLIFIGTLFTRRHGLFTILILVGYILPTILIGLQDGTEKTAGLLLISSAVFAYRFLLSVIGPIWMARSSSNADKNLAVIITVVIALGISVALKHYQILYNNQMYFSLQMVSYIFLEALRIISAVILGLIIYQTPIQTKNNRDRSLITNSAMPPEKV